MMMKMMVEAKLRFFIEKQAALLRTTQSYAASRQTRLIILYDNST